MGTHHLLGVQGGLEGVLVAGADEYAVGDDVAPSFESRLLRAIAHHVVHLRCVQQRPSAPPPRNQTSSNPLKLTQAVPFGIRHVGQSTLEVGKL